MRNKTRSILLLYLIFLMSEIAQAKVIYYGTKPEAVPVRYGMATLLRFTKPVKIISGASKFNLSPASEDSPDYALLALTPRVKDASALITLLLSDETSIKLRVATVANDYFGQIDSLYDFKPKNSPDDPTLGSSSVMLPKTTASDLMRSIIRDDRVSGYEIKTFTRSVKTGLKNLEANLTKIYAGEDFNGYVYELKNSSLTTDYEIDVRRLRLAEPSLALLSYVNLAKLKPRATVQVIVIARPALGYRDVVFPMQAIKKEETE